MSDRLGVRGRLLLAFFGISAFAVLAAAAAMYSFLKVGEALDRITQDRVPATVASQQLSRQAERIAAAAPALLTVDSAADHERMSKKISTDLEHLDRLLRVLRDRDVDPASLILIENLVERLGTNLATVDTMIINNLVLVERASELLRKLRFTYISSLRLVTPGILVMDAKLADLREVLDVRKASGIQRPGEIADLVEPIISLAPLQRAQTEVSAINDKLITAASAKSLADLGVLVFSLRRSLDALEESLASVEPDLGAQLGARLAAFREFVDGADSIVGSRASELRHLALMQTLLDENVDISRHLTEAVDRLVADANRDIRDANLEAMSVQQWGTTVLLAVVGLSLLSSILIVWLYVGRSLIARLTALSDSMLAIAGGDLETNIPGGGNDEIGGMAKALAVFRETAVEVKETNLREIREARRRLIDAIESISEGFALYDSEGRLVLCNDSFRDIHQYSKVDTEPGVATYESLGRRDEAHGTLGRQPISFAQRVAKLRQDGITETIQFIDDRILERRQSATPEGGIISVNTDITERKQAEEELAGKEAQLRVALDNMPGGMFMVDETHDFRVINNQYIELMEFPDGVVREGGSLIDGIKFRAERGDYGPGDPEELVEHRLAGYDNIETHHHEERLPSGKIIEFAIRPLASGGTVGIATDITERKHAEEALQEANGIIKDQKERMEDELNVGREIQMSMIPLVFPAFPDHDEFSIFASLEPAREVAGDFYDFYFVDEDRICFCIGDVSGKGVPSALFMAMTKTLIKSRAADDRSPASILTHLNDELSANNKNCMFVTLFFGIMNIRTGELVYTNAGHNPPYLKRRNGDLLRMDRLHGPMIGAMEGMIYEEDEDTMALGDLLVLYTDGVTEAMDVGERMFSEDRLKHLLSSADSSDVEAVVGRTVAAVKAFEGETEQADDITVLGLAFHGSPQDARVGERRIVIKNNLLEIASVQEKIDAFAEEFDVPVPLAMKLKLIFDEILNNVISYAYRDEAEHDIETRVELAGKRLTVTITDDGVPFNPLSAAPPDTDLPLEEREIGGLGIHLVRNLVDDVSYHRRIDKNVLTMTMHLERDREAS